MIKLFTLFKQKLFFAFSVITFLLGCTIAHSQTSTGMSISWDKEVGCQTYGVDDKKRIFFTDIEESECIRFCENSAVTYTLDNLPAGATTTWTATGGTLSGSSNTSCVVTWGSVGAGGLSFTISYGTTIINKTICVEKILIPKAYFEIAPLGQGETVYTCSNQILNFINLSNTNNGTNLVSYYWDFGDGTSSTAFEPTHTYANDEDYEIILTVRNECNCTDTYSIKVVVKSKGFEISCPSVICEGQTQIYSLPFDGMEICQNNFDWSVSGGHIVSQQGGNVEVIWDAVDQFGFGYVTFNPSHCNMECSEPTTIKIPVIQTNGTIQGTTDLCLGEQGRYKLPQWPTTEIQWQIVGNVANNLADILQTDQRNEVIVIPHVSGQLTLRATYTNTLLHCSGEATFTIQVGIPLEIIGNDAICQNSTVTYSNSENATATWTLADSVGNVLHTENDTPYFTFPFDTPGTFVLTANAGGYCLGEQKTITVVATPAAPAGIAGAIQVCPNSPYTYAVQSPDSNSDYFWVVTNGTIIGADTGDQVNITFNGTFPAAVNVYRKTIAPITCMSSPFALTVNQIPVNVELYSTYPDAICANSLATYQALAAGTTNAYTEGDTYTWSFSNPSLGSVTNGQGTNAIDVTWNNVTSVTNVNLILTVGKCNITPAPQFEKQITLYPKTEIKVVATPNPVCAGPLYPVTFTVESINGVPLVPTDVVTWNLGSGEVTGAAGDFTYQTPLNNTSTVNIGQVMTAFIANANGCGATNSASVTVTVLPNPPGIATLSGVANAFCTEAEIDTSITVASNIVGVSFVWLKDGIPLSPLQSGTTLDVDDSMGFGAYTFEVTNTNGCKTISNPIYVSQVCTIPNCTIPEEVYNTSELTECGKITFSGGYTGTALGEAWQVVGPAPSDYTITAGVLTGKPGNYKIVHKVLYNCLEGGTAYVTTIKDVIIPYAPDFSYTVECANSNSFNVNFLDNSTFYAAGTTHDFRFYYKLAGAGSFTGPITYNPSNTVFELNSLPAGNYVFKQEVDGIYPNTYTYTCSKEYSVNLQGVNPLLSIVVNDNLPIDCHNTAVLFKLSSSVLGSTFLWDFDDDTAQNTLATPLRVFNTPDHTYYVTCKVTNQYGCSETFTAEVYIPKKCFFGDVVATPSSATVCQGQSVTLKYVPNNDNCTVDNYIWMNGSEAIAGAPNSSQLTVTTTGFYWVKVKSADNCEYDTPTQIKPLFNTLPTVKILGEGIYCQYKEVKLTVSTNATIIKWYINNTLYPQFNNLTEASIANFLSVGNNSVVVEVTSAQGCTNSATQVINIVAGLQALNYSVHVSCDPYSVEVTVLPSPFSSDITYNWSNGETTQTINVSDGGAYRVTVTVAGCSYTLEVDVPKNPEDYIWIFPTGCYTDCSTELNYLVGPTLPLNYWGWNLDGNADSSGSGTFASPYTLIKDGAYTLTIDTGDCKIESAPLDYSTTKCDKCKIQELFVKPAVQNDTPYCSYTFNLMLYSGSTVPYQATLTDDLGNVLVLPSTFTIQPGVNSLYFTVIPQSPFNGGTTHWTIQGAVPNDEGYTDCVNSFVVEVPWCQETSSKTGTTQEEALENKTLVQQDLTLYPNPAKDMVTLRYNLSSSNATVEIYDIAGRNISTNVLSSSVGNLEITTSSYPSGIYIVVVKQDGAILAQKKLIIE